MRWRVRQGIALLNVLIFTFLTTTFLVVGIQFTQSAIRQGRSTKSEAQVYNVALAGINHAVFWLQKQDPSQTITTFDPKSADSVGPDEDPETADQQLGLVHEFEVDGTQNLWGRYEVARSEQAPARDDLATGPASTLYTETPTWTAEDMSLARGGDPGTIWRVRSRAYLFERTSSAVPFALPGPDERPLSTITLEAEVRKGGFTFPEAAIYSFKPDSDSGGTSSSNCHIGFEEQNDPKPNTVVDVSLGSATVQHLWSNSSKLYRDGDDAYIPATQRFRTGSTDPASANYVDPSLTRQLKAVFGVNSIEAVKEMASAYYETNGEVPEPQPAGSFIYLKPSSGLATFKEGGGHPTLSGSGVLFVEGDLEIDGDGGEQKWNGFIFVTGDYTQKKRSTITGAVMVGDRFWLEGDGSKKAQIVYDSSELDRINDQIGQVFKLDKATLRVVTGATPAPY